MTETTENYNTAVSGPPAARKENHIVTIHGQTRTDPYHWLRGKDPDKWKKVMRDPSILDNDIRVHLESENAHAAAMKEQIEPVIDAVGDELVSRMKADDDSVPIKDGPYEYWSKVESGKNYCIYMRRALVGENAGRDEVAFDQNIEAQGHDFYELRNLSYSPDHKLLAYVVDTKGSEQCDMRIRNMETGEDFDEVIPDCNGSVVWSSDSKKVFYIENDEECRPRKLKCHVVGDDPSQDTVVYHEDDTGMFLNVGATRSEKYIQLHRGNHGSNEVFVFPNDGNTQPDLKVVRPIEDDVEYNIDHHQGDDGDFFYVHTNMDGAIEYKIMRVPVDDFAAENWENVIAHNPEINISAIACYQDYFVRVQREDGLQKIVIGDYQGQEKSVSFPDAAYEISAEPAAEYDGNTMRVFYETMADPGKEYDVNLETGNLTLLKEHILPSGHDPDDYVVDRLLIPSRDGKEEIPATVLRLKSTPVDGSAPLAIYGYGSYGIQNDPGFSSLGVSIADRGGCYAFAHIRGGTDKGERWYKDGKLGNKLNTFHDFIDVAEGLAERGYGEKGKIAIRGGSAGGMLVGAVINMRPDLFNAVIAVVPFVDVINTICDPSLPLTPPEWNEWGNPIESKEVFDYMMQYSPYDNIDPDATYPMIYAKAGLTDPRVTYWEPAKWIARLRDEAQGGPFYLDTNMGAGHGGASGRYDAIRESAPEIAIMIDQFERDGYDMSLKVERDTVTPDKEAEVAADAADGPDGDDVSQDDKYTPKS